MDPRPDPGAGELRGPFGPAVSEEGTWLARYRPIALRLARGIVGRGDVAEDVVQESACAVLEQLRGRGVCFESLEHARNYFLRTVHNRAVNALRAPGMRSLEGVEDPAPAGCGTPDAAGEDAERVLQVELVLRALAGLRAKDRQALELRYLVGLSYRDISARTGLSISTLHSRVEAALARIRNRIGKEVRGP